MHSASQKQLYKPFTDGGAHGASWQSWQLPDSAAENVGAGAGAGAGAGCRVAGAPIPIPKPIPPVIVVGAAVAGAPELQTEMQSLDATFAALDAETREAFRALATKMQQQTPEVQSVCVRQLKAMTQGMRGGASHGDLVAGMRALGANLQDVRGSARTMRVLCIVHASVGRGRLSSDEEIAALQAVDGVICTVIPATSASISTSLLSDSKGGFSEPYSAGVPSESL